MKLLQNNSSFRKFIMFAGILVVVGALLFVSIQMILTGYSVAWTGFGDYTKPDSNFVREKTFWDWMELLIIPLVLAAGAFFLNHSESAIERQTAESRATLERELAADLQREAVLQSYLDRMEKLLLERKLRTSRNPEVRHVARVQTLTVLQGLDGVRKRIIVKFLYEARLITKKKIIVDLTDANLTGADLQVVHLQDANLKDTNLKDANLQFANLQACNLQQSILRGANLEGAYLESANLAGANLTGANLVGSNLTGANLENAYLEGADLYAAEVTKEQLASTLSLQGAVMPDGTKHD